MGEAKKRGSVDERRAQARVRRAIEIEDAKRLADLPADAAFVGYVVYVKEKDDYLMEITETNSQIHRRYSRTPELAVRFRERNLAEEAASKLPRKAVVGLLFDYGTRLMAVLDGD